MTQLFQYQIITQMSNLVQLLNATISINMIDINNKCQLLAIIFPLICTTAKMIVQILVMLY